MLSTEEELNIYWNYMVNVGASLVAQMVKNPPAMQEIWARSLGWEDPLEEGMATHSSIPAWEIRWTEEPGGLQSMGLQRLGHNLVTKQQQREAYIQKSMQIMDR